MTPAASACILVLLGLGSKWRGRGLDVFFGRRRQLVSEDGEVGAVHAAQIATAALLRMDHVRSVITLGVKSGGERQDVRGTELHAESAGLTSLDYDLHRTLGHCCPFFFFLALRRGNDRLHGRIFLLIELGVAPGITLRLGGSPTYRTIVRFFTS